jgi:hypothetical protein
VKIQFLTRICKHTQNPAAAHQLWNTAQKEEYITFRVSENEVLREEVIGGLEKLHNKEFKPK